jgi:hypothetical protein
MFRRIWQKPAKTSVWQQHQTRKKKQTEGLSFALFCWRNSTLFAVLVCHQLQHNTRSFPSSPSSLSLCVSWLLRSHTVAREKRRGYRRVWLRCARASDGKRTTKSESTAAASFKLRYDIVGTSLLFQRKSYRIALTVHLVHQKLVALDHRAAKKLKRTKVRSRKIERKQAAAVWNGFPNLISSRVFLVCLFVWFCRAREVALCWEHSTTVSDQAAVLCSIIIRLLPVYYCRAYYKRVTIVDISFDIAEPVLLLLWIVNLRRSIAGSSSL